LGWFTISFTNDGSSFFKTSITLPLSASPQILSRGKVALSIIICSMPSLAKKREVVAPAGPAPTIKISVV